MKWQDDHQTGIERIRTRNVRSLDRISGLTQQEKTDLKKVTARYAFRATDYYLNLINFNDPNDPLRRLIIPHPDETIDWGDLDASSESQITVRKGVQHKYRSTVLLLVNETCAGFCRYCFRKRLFMNQSHEVAYDLRPALQYIRQHPEVDNVLLTGGDPMLLSTSRLESIIAALREIEHVRIIRIGTKMPAYNPYRYLNDDALLQMLAKHSSADRRIYTVCHFDHPRELTPQAHEAVRRLLDAGVVCINQHPIVRGISDDPATLAELWNELSYMGVQQYYAFQGRPTAGNYPYVVPLTEAYRKVEQAKRRCSGLGKRVKYVMSHESGKVEMVGLDHRFIYLRYHRALFAEDEQRFFICHRDDKAYWLDQLRPVSGHRNEYYRDSFRPTAIDFDQRLG